MTPRDIDNTRPLPDDPRLTRTAASPGPGSSAGSGAGDDDAPPRFGTGTLIAGRYRVVTLLGRGGMGEVYRAEDTVLSQHVALKFLPAALTRVPWFLEHLLSEVRTARRISHPNVVRIHDVGEHEGERFITMEYIDGEDLRRLLSRVGRFTEEKGVELTRQLCAGLAALHEGGLLHRDLKPANIMIDSRGILRLMDFGLATEIRMAALRGAAPPPGWPAGNSSVGTPAYMAPEQWTGGALTRQTDIYAVGLVMYEIFVGRRAFDADTIAELRDLHTLGTPPAPSASVPTLSPQVERAIELCLAKDPAERPRSAYAVAALLPGGDPLAAAVAEHRTPSPDSIAAAAVGERFSLPWAAGLAGLTLALLAAVLLLANRTLLVGLTPLPRSPAALMERARLFLADAGYKEEARDAAWGFDIDMDRMHWLEKGRLSAADWHRELRQGPAGLLFWFRHSQQRFVPLRPFPYIDQDDPPALVPGSLSVTLTPSGQLRRLIAPPPVEDPGNAAAEPPAGRQADWPRLMEAAEVDPASLEPAAPRWTPPVFSDERRAWTAHLADADHTAVRIEAASHAGRPTYFQVIFPWTPAAHVRPPTPIRIGLATGLAGEGWLIVAIHLTVIVLAVYNLWLGRGDRAGALRVGLLLAACVLLMVLPRFLERPALLASFSSFMHFVGRCLYALAVGALFYLAFEPFTRKIWPQSLVSWTRLIRGRVLCCTVARDILVGLPAGVACVLGAQASWMISCHMGLLPGPPPNPQGIVLATMATPVAGLTAIPFALMVGGYNGLMIFILLVVVRLIVRHAAGSAIVTAVLFTLIFGWGGGHPIPSLAATAVLSAIVVSIVLRFGLLSLLTAWIVYTLLLSFPLTLDWQSWLAPITLVPVAITVLLAAGTLAALFLAAQRERCALPRVQAAPAGAQA